MIETLSNPTSQSQLAAVLPQMISALVGGGIAFAVSLATNRASNDRLREQFSLEKEAARVKETRAKGEELFVLLHFWTSHTIGHYLTMSMAMQGKLSVAEVQQQRIEGMQKFASKYEAPRIELYVKAYFPNCSALHIKLLQIMSKLNNIETEFEHSLENELWDGGKFLQRYVATQHDFERCNLLLQESLIQQIREI